MSSGFYKNFLCNTDNTTETTKDCVKTTSISNSGYVGLPRYGEMFASQQESGYSSSSYMWLMNPYSTSGVWNVDNDGNGSGFNSPSSTYGGRPSINLKSGIQLSGGSGTKANPYTILGDKEEVTIGTTLLNTRSSGEYVKFNNELYRIVSIENEITKINKNDYIRDTSNNVLTKKF